VVGLTSFSLSAVAMRAWRASLGHPSVQLR
jgi:hypothetical protein